MIFIYTFVKKYPALRPINRKLMQKERIPGQYQWAHKAHKLQILDCPIKQCCHEDSLFVEMLLKSCSGNSVSGLPIRKWPGVSAWRSLGSVDMVVIRREFRMDPTYMMKVFNFS